MNSTSTLTAMPAMAPDKSQPTLHQEPQQHDVVATWRARWEAGTTNGLWPETDTTDADEPIEDPAADRLDWDLR